MKRLALSLLGLAAQAGLFGQHLYYGFEGELGSVLTPSGLTDNTYPFDQVAGRLVYHNNGQVAEDSTTILELLDFHPTKSVSWTLQVDVIIPSLARIDNPQPGAECNLMLGCYNNKDGSLRAAEVLRSGQLDQHQDPFLGHEGDPVPAFRRR